MRLTVTSPLLAITAALTLAISIPTQAADSSQPELLAQYDFERIPMWIPDWGAGYDSVYKPAAGWKTPFKVTLDDEDPHSGDRALRLELLEVPTSEIIVHSPAIPLPELPTGETRDGAKVIIRAYVRTQGLTESGAGLRILEKNKDGKSLGLLDNQNIIGPITESAAWTELTVEGTLRNGTHSIVFMLVSNIQQVPLSIWIDDISIEFVK